MVEVIKNEKESVFGMLQIHEMIITRTGESFVFVFFGWQLKPISHSLTFKKKQTRELLHT